jgi:Zn-dependent protease with chaperone function
MTRAFSPAVRGLCGLLLAAALAGCAAAPAPSPSPAPGVPAPVARLSPDAAVRNFNAVVRQVEPVAEAECRSRTRGLDCDFLIQVDTRRGQPVNAFHTVDAQGRPLIVFTLAMIGEARNQDELAFVMGHEAAHHIAGHLVETQRNAGLGAVVFGALASLATSGASEAVRQATMEQALQAGAFVGARSYSKENELEADALGTVIAARAGFDPLRGALFFARIPDPGDQFLGSHPPNAARFETVRQVAATL